MRIVDLKEMDFVPLPPVVELNKSDLISLISRSERARGDYQPFVQLLTGKSENIAAREIEVPFQLIQLLGRMREWSLTNDQELSAGIYWDPKDGRLLLSNAVLSGRYSYIDNYYECPPPPLIEECDLVVNIHSHPNGEMIRSSMNKAGKSEKFRAEVLAGQNFPSLTDLIQLVVLNKKHPFFQRDYTYLNTVQAEIVVGPSVAVLVSRTPNTPDRGTVMRLYSEKDSLVQAAIISQVRKKRPPEFVNWHELRKKIFDTLIFADMFNLRAYVMPLSPNNQGIAIPVPYDLDHGQIFGPKVNTRALFRGEIV